MKKRSHRQMLEEPCSHDVCGHLGEDPSLLVVPPVSVRVVLLACARGGHSSVQTIACRDAHIISHS